MLKYKARKNELIHFCLYVPMYLSCELDKLCFLKMFLNRLELFFTVVDFLKFKTRLT
jgi:hypothetical protein